MKFLIFVLGALFGLLSPNIVRRIERNYQKKEVREAIFIDLEELFIKVILLSFRFRAKTNQITREYLDRIYPFLSIYDGVNKIDGISTLIRRVRDLEDENIQEAMDQFNQLTNAEDTALMFPDLGLPFISSRLNCLDLFDKKFISHILVLSEDVNMTNDIFKQYRRNVEKTYDENLGVENLNRIRNNIEEITNTIILRTDTIINKINMIFRAYRQDYL